MNQTKLSLSLILITRDRCDELRKTLQTVDEQSEEFELIIADNGSDDGTVAMITETCPNAIVLELGENQGVSGGRNRGIEAASGDILIFLDDDASFGDPEAFLRIRRRFLNDPQLGILASNSHLTATGEPEVAAIPRRDKKVMLADYEASYFCGVGFAVRREVFDTIGLFFEPYIYSCEELDLSWRAVEAGYRITWAADIIVWHRRSPLARPQGRWVHSNAKNRLWLSARHLPWRYVASHAVFWWMYLFWVAMRNGLLRDYFNGVAEGIRRLPDILAGRKRLSNQAINRIKSNHGRLLW